MRFDFDINWKKVKLGEILKIKSGMDQKKVETQNGKYNIYGTGGIIGKTNTPIYSKESVGIGRKGTIDKPFYFSEPFWTVDTLFYSEIKSHHVKFIYYLFQTINWKFYNQSTGVPSLTSSVIENISINIPSSLEEERKIADFLSEVDERILTQKKIIEDLNILKMSINSQASKQKGINFKIKDICVIGRGRVISNEEIKKQKNPIYPVFSSQTQNNGIMGYLDSYEFDGEYITWTTDGANAGTIFYHNEKFNCTNVCGTLKVNNQDVSAKYLSSILPYYVKKYVSKNLANPKLMNNTMSNIEVNVIPKIEQIKFINTVTSIEEKLNNEKSILKLYIKQKEYLLNNLFI